MMSNNPYKTRAEYVADMIKYFESELTMSLDYAVDLAKEIIRTLPIGPAWYSNQNWYTTDYVDYFSGDKPNSE